MNDVPSGGSSNTGGPSSTSAPLDLAQWQSALVDIVVLGADPALLPTADASRLLVMREQLTGKHAGIVRQRWPGLAAAVGDRWSAQYAAWEAGRPWRGPTVAGVGLAAQLRDDPDPAVRREAAAILDAWRVVDGTARERWTSRLRRVAGRVRRRRDV